MPETSPPPPPLARAERRALLAVLLAALILHLTGIWWGLPGLPRSWAADEFSPFTVHDGVSRWFSGGWFDLYPPFHIYVLTAALSPILALAATGTIEFTDPTTYTVAFYVMRLVSVAMAAGVLVVTFHLGRELFDVRSGIFAALAAGLMAPFVYYAKLANVEVPYLFWLSLSLLFYVRILDRHAMRDYLAFAVTAALAIGTKDQAYGFYLLMPAAIAISDARLRARVGAPAPLWRSVVNVRMLATLGTGALVLALVHNLPFNWSGAFERVRIMTGPITQDLQEFPNTPAGHAAMLGLAVRHLQFSFGWPLLLAATAGLLMVLARWRRHPRALALLLPIVSYWLFLIVPIMYHYDRYLLGVALILAPFAGVALASLAAPGRFVWLRRAVVLVAVLFTVAYAASVDVLLVSDSRYAAERWAQQHIPKEARVLAIGHDTYLPRLWGLEVVTSVEPTLAELEQLSPDYVVTSSAFEDWRFRDKPDSLAFLRALRGGQTRYEVVFDHRARPAFNLLEIEGMRTNLDKINPRIRVYRRLPR